MKPAALGLGILLAVTILLASGSVFITDQAIDYREFSGSITHKYSAVVKVGFGSEHRFYFIIDDTKEVNVGRQTYFQHEEGDNYVQTTEDLTTAGELAIIGIIAGMLITIIVLVLYIRDCDRDRRLDIPRSLRRKR